MTFRACAIVALSLQVLALQAGHSVAQSQPAQPVVEQKGWWRCTMSTECIAVLNACMGPDAINRSNLSAYRAWHAYERTVVNCAGTAMRESELANLVRRKALTVGCREQRCTIAQGSSKH